MTSRNLSFGLMLAVAAIVGSALPAVGQPLRPMSGGSAIGAANGFPAARCSRPLDQETARIQRLAQSLADARAAAEKNPLLLADVGYYEAELAASRRCLPSVAAR